MRSISLPLALCLLIVWSVAPTAHAADPPSPAPEGPASKTASPEADLWRAAQEGDTARVRRLLADGVDPDAPARYGVTALGFAASKGHEDIVRLLLDAGADPDVTDSFYGQTPMGWAISDGHLDIVLRLVRAGAESLDDALMAGIRAGHPELVREALDRATYYPWWRTVGLELAQQAEATARGEGEGEGGAKIEAAPEEEQAARREITRLLRETPVAEELPKVKIASARLDVLSGAYEGQEGAELTVRRTGETLEARLPGREEPVALLPVSDEEFRVVGDLDTGVYFFGRGGVPETVMVMTGLDASYFRRPDADEDTPARAAVDPSTSKPGAQERETRTAAVTDPNWPSFRGPGATGLGSGDPPVTWDVATGDNVLWKAELPGLGNSSPVVWGDRVYVTTAVAASGDRSIKIGRTGDVSTHADDSEHTWWVLAFDKATGRELWRRQAGHAVPEAERHFKSTQANPTPAVDGSHVVAVFPTAGLVVYNPEGELLWKKDLGALDAGWFYDPSFGWGYGSSPILHDGKVILQVDARDESYLAAWDADTGDEVWRARREELPTWSTPVVARGPKGLELITNGPTIRAYDPATGKELWHLGPNSEMVVATPVAGDGMVYVSAGYPPVRPIYAIKLGGRGDLSLPEGKDSSEQVSWSFNRGGAYMPTPILVDGLYYIGHHDSRLIAYDAATGETVYKARFSQGGTFTGSPVHAGGKLYFTTEEGLVYVVKAGREHEELAVNDLDEITMTTPAVSEGVLFLRTRTELIAVGKKAERGAAEAGR